MNCEIALACVRKHILNSCRYNAGHLIEAAIAHQHLYKNDLLLEPILKYVKLLCKTFGPGEAQLHGYPGHPEIELALLRLYDHAGQKEHLDLARYFLTERGNSKGWYGRHYYDVEAERRGDDPNKRPAFYPQRRCLWYVYIVPVDDRADSAKVPSSSCTYCRAALG